VLSEYAFEREFGEHFKSENGQCALERVVDLHDGGQIADAEKKKLPVQRVGE